MKLSGSEIIIESLKKEGVEFIFGYPGGAVLHIYDALFAAKDIKHVLVRHEQGATHAADGYARACNKPGVVLVTSGPGITNCVTGIATAHMDSIPKDLTDPKIKINFEYKKISKYAPTVLKKQKIKTKLKLLRSYCVRQKNQ